MNNVSALFPVLTPSQRKDGLYNHQIFEKFYPTQARWIQYFLDSGVARRGQGGQGGNRRPDRNSASLSPPKWNYTLYRGLWRAAIFSPYGKP